MLPLSTGACWFLFLNKKLVNALPSFVLLLLYVFLYLHDSWNFCLHCVIWSTYQNWYIWDYARLYMKDLFWLSFAIIFRLSWLYSEWNCGLKLVIYNNSILVISQISLYKTFHWCFLKWFWWISMIMNICVATKLCPIFNIMMDW